MWADHGWVLLPGVFDAGETLRVNDLVEDLWRTRPAAVTVDDVDAGVRTRFSRLPVSARPHRVKISDLYLRYAEVREALLAPQLVSFLTEVLGDEPVLCNSLNMEHGSAQEFHADSLFMTPLTRGGLAATWIALEDVRAGSGPLRVYSGSHQIEPYRFSNGDVHVVESELPRWAEYMQGELDRRGLVPESISPKAGDVIVWNSDLVHGAEPITDPASTRRSLVGHYFRLADARRRGYAIEGEEGRRWVCRRPQPVDFTTRALSAVERRVERLRALWRRL